MTQQKHMEQIRRIFKHQEAIDWNDVFLTELPRILNYFRFHGLEDAVSEDLTSSTFEKAWRSRNSYHDEKASTSTWLFSIAHNTMIDHFRTANFELPLDFISVPPVSHVEISPEDSIQDSDLRERLRRLLCRLPERERELIALKYGAEMTNRAIAKQTGLSESNVGTILSRTVHILRTKMEEES